MPAGKAITLPAVPLTARAQKLGPSITGRIADVRGVTTKTRLPGEVGGASIAVTVELVNRSTKSVSVGNVVVDATDSTGAPASAISAAPARPFRASLAAGHSARGVYVFTMAANRRHPISVTVNYAAGTPVARFVGNVK